MFDFTLVFKFLILLLSSIISVYLFPIVKDFIRSKLSENEYKILTDIVHAAVISAEAIWGEEYAEDKFDYVLDLAESYLFNKGITFDREAIKAVIENELKKAKVNGEITRK